MNAKDFKKELDRLYEIELKYGVLLGAMKPFVVSPVGVFTPVGDSLDILYAKRIIYKTDMIPDKPVVTLGTNEYLVLDVPVKSLKELCEKAGVEYIYNDDNFEAFDKETEDTTKPRWIIVNNGVDNHNRSSKDCRSDAGFIGLTAKQAVLAYIQYPEIVKEGKHIMDLPGSVHRAYRGCCAYLGVWSGRARLDWSRDGHDGPQFGSASRRRC